MDRHIVNISFSSVHGNFKMHYELIIDLTRHDDAIIFVLLDLIHSHDIVD